MVVVSVKVWLSWLRTMRATNTAARVRNAITTNPIATYAEIAAQLRLSVSTVSRHAPGRSAGSTSPAAPVRSLPGGRHRRHQRAAAGRMPPGPMTLYRGEGSHTRPSYYTHLSGDAGGWWALDLEAALRYAKSTKDGKVYIIEVDGLEVESRGLHYFIPDPNVRERRRLLGPTPGT